MMGGQIRTGVLPLAILSYAALALAMAPATYLSMAQSYFMQAVILPLVLCICLPLFAVLRRPAAPFSLMREVLVKGTPRLVVVAAMFCIGLSAFTTFKLAIPGLVPFYADTLLADIDAWLHHGNPGEFAHAIVPDWAQYPLGYLYGPVWATLWFGLLAFVSLHDNGNLRRRYFWSMALTICLLGTVAATAFSSVGPIFYAEFVEPTRFADLTAAIGESAVGDYMAQVSGYLLAGYHSGVGKMGTGISAMPSMHLAIATLNACMLSSLNRTAGIAGWVYVALILLGSVYLGWHYAIDGYFSIAAVTLIWWVAGKVTADRSAFAEPARVEASDGIPVAAE